GARGSAAGIDRGLRALAAAADDRGDAPCTRCTTGTSGRGGRSRQRAVARGESVCAGFARLGAPVIVAFLGPSLPAAQAPRGVTLLPPARQGDVWRAMRLKPRAIALIDGVFESQPSVWHHEILDALDAGIAVLG